MIIVTLLTVSRAADGVLQAYHVDSVSTQLFYVMWQHIKILIKATN